MTRVVDLLHATRRQLRVEPGGQENGVMRKNGCRPTSA
jgi:hypothetical protein